MTNIEKGISAAIFVLILIIGLSTCALMEEFDGCTPSVVTETRDGKEVTSLECKP